MTASRDHCFNIRPIAVLALAWIGACSSGSDSPTGPHTGTLTGVVSTSLGSKLFGISVVVTPSGSAPLAPVVTAADGSFRVTSVPSGSGTITLPTVPAGCTPPVASPYSLSGGGASSVHPLVACSAVTGSTSLNVNEAAVFADSAPFGTDLTLAPNGVYLLTVVNTDTDAASLAEFQILGTPPAAKIAGAMAAAATGTGAPPPPVAPMRRPSTVAPARRAPPSREFDRLMRYSARLARNHLAILEQNRAVMRRHGDPVPALLEGRRSARANAMAPGVPARSLVGSAVGDVNRVYVRGTGDCGNVDSINARTVFVGAHVQVLADTNTSTWPAAYRPDSAFYAQFGWEYDTLTYAKHLLTFIGDPLEFDSLLLGVGKVTIVFTPALNALGGGVLAFVNPCDFYPTASIPRSNVTEIFYMLVPSANGFPVSFWEAIVRPTAAHESKHIVSIGDRFLSGGDEETWLEEGLAQVSAEIWGRNYNLASWRGFNGFSETIGCEPTWSDPPCPSAGHPFTFTFGHFPYLYLYLSAIDSASAAPPESFDGTLEGVYGAGWVFTRWAIDNYAPGSTPADEGAFIKEMIRNTAHTGLDNVSSLTGVAGPRMLVYWSLATALDQSSLDYYGNPFNPPDPRLNVPSFNLRNIFGVLSVQSTFYARAAPVRTYALTPGAFQYRVTGIPGTGKAYFLLQSSGTGSIQALQLLSGSGGPIPSTSGFRVGIIRIN